MSRITGVLHHQNATPHRGGAREHLDVQIAELTVGQHCVLSRPQLAGRGATEDAIRHRLAVRRLHRIHRGVYSVVPPSLLSRNGRYMAGVLACGDGAVLSHRAAGALLELRSSPSGPVDVTIPRRVTRKQRGIRAHSSRRLHPDDVTAVDGIPCTSVARTLVDLAAVETRRALTRAVEQALILRIFDGAALEAQLERANGRKGTGVLRRLLAEIADHPPNTANDFERDLLFLIEEENLTRPIVNGWVCGYQVDFHWPDAKLVVETDGRATHGTPIAFERDRERDLVLELAGWHVLRISARQLRRDPRRVATLIRAKLAYAGGGGTGSAVAAAASMSPHP